MERAGYCLKSRNIFTGKKQETEEGCVLIKGDHILDVVPFGSESKYLDEYTVVLECGDKLIMPGFVDAHTHFFSGALASSSHVCEEIKDSTSEEECAQMVLEYARKHPNERRIRGRGWFVTNWDDAPLPTKASLDAVLPDIPVYLQAADCHSYWLNSKALEECGVTSHMGVESGYIGKLEKGELSGMLVEMEAMKPADEMYNAFTKEELRKIYSEFMEMAAANGVTSMSEMMPHSADEESLIKYDILKDMEAEGTLSTRVHIYTKLYGGDDFMWMRELRKKYDSSFVRISGAKGFIDGVTETYTGLLLEPYTDRPDTCGVGVPAKPYEVLLESVIAANRADLPVRIHCIADGSVRMALDVFEESVKVNGKNPFNAIEHIENIHPEDIPRFRELSVLPSMQPIHILLDAGGKMVRIGNERIRYEWPLKTMLNACGRVALGTDFPVVSINPFANVYAAVTRKDFSGRAASHNPGECLTMGETLQAYTSMAAQAYGREDIGTLDVGKLADIVVLNCNLFDIPESKILDAKVEMTMVNGRIVYEKAER